jgi:hypothetical protein
VAIWSRFFGTTASTAAGYGIGSALGPALNPLTQRVANEQWTAHPFKPLTPEEAAEAVVRDLLTEKQGNIESHKSGLDDDAWRVLRGLAGEPPGAQQLLELWNREQVTEAEVDRGLRQSRMRPEWYPAFKKLRNVLVPVSDLVRMAVREVFDPEQRAALDLDADYPADLTPEARKLGLSETDARRYWAAHWNLPSYEQASQMLFRGELTQAQFDGLLRALDYAPTWRSKLKTIARAIPTTADFIRFAVREVYSPDVRARFGQDDDYPEEFTAKAALHGLAEEDARAYWAAHWELPSTEQGFRMLHRDIITKGDLELLLRAKDVMPFWRGKLEEIAYLVPGRVDLRRMYAAGVIDRKRVKRGYLDIGYKEADAEALTDFAVALADQSGAAKADTHEGKAQLQLWNTLHSAYLAGDATDAVVNAKLPQAGVSAAVVPKVLATWKHEREIQRQRLTATQVKKAYKKAVRNPTTGAAWTRDDALAELLSRGWSAQDANTFLDE